MSFARHPVWLVGFRPFFALACLAGLSLPLVWVLMLAGVFPSPSGRISAIQWHAHEMFFGFGWAVLGGFLLTSTKNWVNIRGYHGPALMLLVAAWLFERFALAWGGHWPAAVFVLAANAFLGAIISMLLLTLIRYRKQDSYRDNLFFIVALPLFLIAKNLLLSPEHFAAGWAMTLALFRLAFLVMFERTLSQFMKAAFQVSILRHPALDLAIKGLALLLVAEPFLPPALAQSAALMAAFLLLLRFLFWKPQLAMTRIDIGVMFLGYLAIVAQLILSALTPLLDLTWVGNLGVHVFTFGAMGLVIPAMLNRIARGHTGRKVIFERADKAILWIMVFAFAARIIGPQLAPQAYTAWLHLAATCWLLAFAGLAWRIVPFLLAARIDGREH